MTSPWPEVEAARNKIVNPRGRQFKYLQCVDEGCRRWYPSEVALDAIHPLKCPLHDELEQARRKARSAKSRAARKSRG